MSYPPPSHRRPRSVPPPRPRPTAGDEPYRSSRFRTATRSGGPQGSVVEHSVVEHSVVEHSVVEHSVVEHSVVERSLLQVEPAEQFEPVPEPTRAAPEWFWLVWAAVSRERVAVTVAVAAVSIAALVIVVIPVITG